MIVTERWRVRLAWRAPEPSRRGKYRQADGTALDDPRHARRRHDGCPGPGQTAFARSQILDWDPPRQVDEDFGRADGTVRLFVQFFAIQTQTRSAKLHGNLSLQ